MTTYRLASAPHVYTPGIVRWAINGYHFKKDRAVLVKVLAGWNLPKSAIHALLSKAVPYTVEGETVVFTVED